MVPCVVPTMVPRVVPYGSPRVYLIHPSVLSHPSPTDEKARRPGEKTVQSHSRLLCPIQSTPCYKHSLELHFWNDIFDRKARTALWAPCVQASAFDVSK